MEDIPDTHKGILIVILLIVLNIAIIGFIVWCLVMSQEKAKNPPESQLGREYVLIQGNSLKAAVPPVHIQPQVLGVMYHLNGEERTWNINVAYAVMMAESGGNPNNINWKDYHRHGNCWGSFGLFQLACFRGTQEELLNSEINTKLAYELWRREGWRPWGAFTNGSYRRFLVN